MRIAILIALAFVLGFGLGRVSHPVAEPASTSHTSNDGKTLILDVPAVEVSTSRAIYDRFLETLKATLGADRYAAFNALSG